MWHMDLVIHSGAVQNRCFLIGSYGMTIWDGDSQEPIFETGCENMTQLLKLERKRSQRKLPIRETWDNGYKQQWENFLWQVTVTEPTDCHTCDWFLFWRHNVTSLLYRFNTHTRMHTHQVLLTFMASWYFACYYFKSGKQDRTGGLFFLFFILRFRGSCQMNNMQRNSCACFHKELYSNYTVYIFSSLYFLVQYINTPERTFPMTLSAWCMTLRKPFLCNSLQ